MGECQRAGARGEAREARRASELGGTTRRRSAPRDRFEIRRLRAKRTVGPRTDETRGRSEEGARGDAPVLERDGHGVRACTTPLARVRTRLATSRARVCGDPHDRNALKRVDAAAIGLAPLNPKAAVAPILSFLGLPDRRTKKGVFGQIRFFVKKNVDYLARTAAFVSRPPVPRDGSPPGPRAARRGGRAVRTPHRPPRPSARVVLLGRGAV